MKMVVATLPQAGVCRQVLSPKADCNLPGRRVAEHAYHLAAISLLLVAGRTSQPMAVDANHVTRLGSQSTLGKNNCILDQPAVCTK
jgi:hypothetical protein